MPRATFVAVAAVALLAPGTSVTAAPISPDDLQNAPVPGGMCRHPKGHLVNGSRDFGINGGDMITDVAIGRAGGGSVAAVAIGCSAGGVSWPETIVFYSKNRGRPAIAAKVYLGRFRAAEHADVKSMTATGGRLHVVWNTYEGCCFETQRFTADMRVRAGKVYVTSLSKGRIKHPYP